VRHKGLLAVRKPILRDAPRMISIGMKNQNSRTRNVAMVLGGVAAGMVGSRLLPPVFAAMTASNRARAGGDPFALLIEDHRQIRSILDEMVAAPTASTVRRGRLFLMLKRKLAKHAMAEEDVVYPIVRSDSANGGERKHLYDEHADMKILLHTVESQLKAGEDWTTSVLPLRDLIRRHAEEEESTIFPELRRELGREMLPKVSGQISREEALIV
jgi:hemerythrin superfamily protein